MPQSDFWPFMRNHAVEDVDNSMEQSLSLQKQLGDMEGEVKEIQMELAAIKRDRLDLHNRRQKLLCEESENVLVKDSGGAYEHFVRSQENKYDPKLTEVTKLREDLIRAKCTADEERFQREKYEEKLRDLEQKLNNICCVGTETDMKTSISITRKSSDTEEISNLKTQVRDMKEEIDELRLTVSEKNEQVQEYRVKYLQAQQQVEELRRQLDVIEYDNKQVSDQIQIEIQKMKMQFQEKLQELAPLPDLLKGAQIQLQEAKQMQKLAEDGAQQLSYELHSVKEKILIAVKNYNQEKADKAKLANEYEILMQDYNNKDKEIEELGKLLDDHKCNELRLEEKLLQQENRFKEKSIECTQLLKDLEELRTENSRSLSRCKERSDSMRRHLQTQISELERQLIQSRAQHRACQKERDEIRQRMTMQINNLQENFELVEIRLRALQNQVTSLKTSYTVILADDDEANDVVNKITTV